MNPFDIRGPLPGTGTTLLEASAGTGKTWTIGALVTRYVVEGRVPLEEMLVVTFGRTASQELRERVRAHLVEAERALASGLADEEFLAFLVDVDATERAVRLARVRAALTGFDTSTIATIHQFCQLVLRGLGVAGDTDDRARLVEDLDELVIEVVDDLYLRGFSDVENPPFTRAEALALGRQAVRDPQARLEPAGADPVSPAGARVRFATDVRAETERRKRRQAILSYDDLLAQVADALLAPESPARLRMRARWRLVLVDEFQDTDPVQWQVFDRAFTGHATMVLIGDPKQSIYAFRGGDVTTYLTARATAAHEATLATNWRSDEPLLDAVQVAFRQARLGDERIVVHDVAARHPGSRLAGAPVEAPFRLRVVRRDDLQQFNDLVRMPALRQHIAEDVAHDIKRLLVSEATFDGVPLAAGQVAVLSGKHSQGMLVREALARVGVPSVVAGNGSVFATPAATEWLTLLEAMEQPQRSGRVRAAALTAFVGTTAAELAEAGDAGTEAVADLMRDWADLFAQRGVAAVFETSVYGHRLAERVLGTVNGERDLTDLRHIAEAMHAEVSRNRLGLVALVGWLHEQMADDKVDVASERTRRLDSDAAAVQIATIHGSKGLQYPVVYVPFAMDRWIGTVPSPVRFHDGQGRRCLDVGGTRSDATWTASVAAAKAEDAGESLRLLYVALTRAQSQLVAWWGPGSNTSPSELHRLLLGRSADQGPVPDTAAVPTDESAWAAFERWASVGGPVVEVSRVEPVSDDVLSRAVPALAVREFTRHVDTSWRRTSYSSLTRAAHPGVAPSVGSEPEAPPRDDEALPVSTSSTNGEASSTNGVGGSSSEQLASPMAELPVGATFGSLVHAVLEHADPSADDLREELAAVAVDQLLMWPVELDVGVLADALVAVCDSPLGPLADGATLRSIAARDRMCELVFELPLAGGDDRGYRADAARLAELAPVLRRHLDPGDPVLAFADAVEDPVLGDQDLRGYLTGSLDVVLRVGDRFLVADYKTNWLGPADQLLTAAAYTPAALDAAMSASDYPLQAVLYAVVLHRFLRWRLPGYDPEAHLGGVLYLYVRGMCGPDTPLVDGQPCGVFSWRPPVALVDELSDLLDGRVRS